MKIERKMMQVMTGSKAEATEEGAEMQEDDVATWELKSRHQEHQCNHQQYKLMSRQGD